MELPPGGVVGWHRCILVARGCHQHRERIQDSDDNAPTSTVTTVGRSEFQRPDRLSLTDVGAAVVVKPERGLAVAEDVGDRTVGLAGVEHCRRRVMEKVLELKL